MSAIIPIISLLGTAASATGTIISATKKTKVDDTAAQLAAEAQRKSDLDASRQTRLRQRRSAGSGQSTVLTGSEGSTEIGRSVLLGQ